MIRPEKYIEEKLIVRRIDIFEDEAGPLERLFTKQCEAIMVIVALIGIGAVLWLRQEAIIDALSYYPV
jgi:hypothetical protein